MQFRAKESQLSLAALFAAIVFVVCTIDDVNSLPSFSCARNCFAGIKDFVLSRSEAIKEFQRSMDVVKTKYQLMKQNGELEGKDNEECEKVYKQLVIEELRKLRVKFESRNKNGESKRQMASEADLDNLGFTNGDSMMGACSRISQCIDSQEPEEELEWDPDAQMDEEQELKLLDELEDLERLSKEEAMMGWSMDAINDIKRRTQVILTDLLDNEVRKVALAVVSAYLTGGALGPILSPLLISVQAKVLDYVTNVVLDLLTSLVGKPKKPIESRFQPEQFSLVATSAPEVETTTLEPVVDAMDID